MFGLGMGEILVVLVFALVVLGPKKIPEIAKSLGKGLREFQKAKDDFMGQMNETTPPPANPPAGPLKNDAQLADADQSELPSLTEVAPPIDHDNEYDDDDHHLEGHGVESGLVDIEIDGEHNSSTSTDLKESGIKKKS